MLAKPTKAIGEVLDRFENKRFTCEYKYDGERAQVHKTEDSTIHVFSRNSEDMSKKYPDLMEQMPRVGKRYTLSIFVDAGCLVHQGNYKELCFRLGSGCH
jgi:DNA ligase 1